MLKLVHKEKLFVIFINHIGIFSLKINIFQGSDKTMLNKLHQKHGGNKNYLKPKSDMNTSFGLNHFAGVVFYDTRAFLEKNRDTFRSTLFTQRTCDISWNRSPKVKNKVVTAIWFVLFTAKLGDVGLIRCQIWNQNKNYPTRLPCSQLLYTKIR